MIKRAIVALALLAGCSSWPPVAQSPERQAMSHLSHAWARWAKAAGAPAPPVHIELRHGAALCGKVLAEGCFNFKSRRLWVNVDAPRLEMIALHEVGHAYGVRHHNGVGNVRNSPPRLPCISGDDLAQIGIDRENAERACAAFESK